MPVKAPDVREVTPTRDEIDAWHQRRCGATGQHRCRNRHPYRVECRACGRRMWLSGIGLGAHRRACRGSENPVSAFSCEPEPEFGGSQYRLVQHSDDPDTDGRIVGWATGVQARLNAGIVLAVLNTTGHQPAEDVCEQLNYTIKSGCDF